MTKKIVWEPWADPFDEGDDDSPEEEGYKDSYDRETSTKKSFNGPMLVGPMGVVPLREGFRPSKLYNFWMMHTNFNISPKVENLINRMEGVEALDVFTRYRARVAFGKVFSEREVQKNIDAALLKEPEPEKKSEETSSLLADKLNQRYAFWAILELENKNIEIVSGDSKEKVQQSITEYTNAKIKQVSWKD